MPLSDVQAYAAERVAVAEAYQQDVAWFGAVRVGGSEEASAGAGGVEGADLVLSKFGDGVGAFLEGGAGWRFDGYTPKVVFIEAWGCCE
jgi:hypothetical protein